MISTAELAQRLSEQSGHTPPKIVILGDVMLDSYIYGTINRISPEAPVPVLAKTNETSMLGGAGNVVQNILALGVQPATLSVIGDDSTGKDVCARIRDTSGLVLSTTRPTTTKTRFVCGSQQLMRLDAETTAPLSAEDEAALLAKIPAALKGASVLVISDYGKGVLTQAVLDTAIKAAIAAAIPVIVDPKGTDFSKYKGASYVTPNLKELSGVQRKEIGQDDALIAAEAEALRAAHDFTGVLVTRSEKGMSLITEGNAVHIPTHVADVYDVSGAGDTVVAYFALSLACGLTAEEASTLANSAAALAVRKKGTSTVSLSELTGGMIAGMDGTVSPHLNWEETARQIKEWQAQGLKVGFTNGCFDIIHYGHVNYLNEARKMCDRLVLGLNHDVSVKILKGESRPINDEVARARVMGALGSVDCVVLFGATKEGEDNTPCALLDAVRPDIIFKGGDYTIDQLPEAKVVHAYGGEVALMNLYEGYSTTNIIKKSQAA
ncbi:MAG: D-glycero-beta-D-manno-heptose-7-phosphate kinase [Pseudobdellovibrionaceae bacterium]